MPLQDTGLIIQGAPLPETFKNTPQKLYEAILRRLKIVSASGVSFIHVSDTEPSSDVGPWLRFGTQWWVFDEATKRYVPLDISESEKQWFQVGASTPATGDPPVWLRTTKDQTEADPSIGQPVSWYVFDGTNWIPFVGVVTSGPSNLRPGNPVAFQQYYDTTISALIWYERNAWRTVDGNIGDIKQVAHEILSDALTNNPGWELFGAGNPAIRGRYLMQATKDPGATPESDFSTSPNVPHRSSFEVFGENDGIQIDNTAPTLFYPPTIALWTLVKT